MLLPGVIVEPAAVEEGEVRPPLYRPTHPYAMSGTEIGYGARDTTCSTEIGCDPGMAVPRGVLRGIRNLGKGRKEWYCDRV
eukprot:1550468-Rhodomonas_salina.1